MKRTLPITVALLATFTVSQAQSWEGTNLEFTSPGTAYTKFQFAEHTWSGSHAILFNAYKSVGVDGNLSVTGNTKYANNQGAYGGGAGAIMFFAHSGSMEFFVTPASGADSKDKDVNWGEAKMHIKRNGEVGIGTYDTDGYQLSVAGKVRTEEVRVDAAPWPDYVFSDNYELKSLEETEAYIKTNKHLPGIPSAEEVSENGIALGEMNAKLLEKVEELTLYVIRLNSENRELKERFSQMPTAKSVEELKHHVADLEKRNKEQDIIIENYLKKSK